MTGNDSSSRTDTMGAYDAIAPLYAEYSGQKRAYLDAVDKMVISHLKPTDRWLDIGAGDGRRLSKIKHEVGLQDVVAIEPSSEMAKICRKTADVPVHEVFGEEINQLDIGKFTVATALWNVFGHIPDGDKRLQTLVNIREKLTDNGIVILDVNNRHNAVAYGTLKVLVRYFVDRLNFEESRGDAAYDWKIGDKVFKSRGHLFTPSEMHRLFQKAGLKIKAQYSVNYLNGEISKSPFRGQLFFILQK